MSEESKYYTPSIEEFNFGFDFELNNGFEFKKHAFPSPWLSVVSPALFENLSNLIQMNAVRVKQLDKEDIESEGWESLGSGWYNLKEVPGKLGYWNYVRLRIWGPNTFIKAYKGNPDDYPNTEQEHLFQGSINNKSELKKLMVQLGIK